MGMAKDEYHDDITANSDDAISDREYESMMKDLHDNFLTSDERRANKANDLGTGRPSVVREVLPTRGNGVG